MPPLQENRVLVQRQRLELEVVKERRGQPAQCPRIMTVFESVASLAGSRETPPGWRRRDAGNRLLCRLPVRLIGDLGLVSWK